VRLKHAYYIKAKEAVKDADGNIVELKGPPAREARQRR